MARLITCALILACFLLAASGFAQQSNYVLKIANRQDVVKGVDFIVPVTIEAVGTRGEPPAAIDLGGFKLVIAFPDNNTVQFTEVYEGSWMSECGWEYLHYGLDALTYLNCDGGNDPGVRLITVVGLADLGGGGTPSCFHPDQEDLPAELVRLKFHAISDNSAPLFITLDFYWRDCTENSLSDLSGQYSLLADNVYDYSGTPVSPGPPCGGPEASCYTGGTEYQPLRKVDFHSGSVDFCDLCTRLWCITGDLNWNGVPYEIADAVMFTNYFISGLNAIHPDRQVAEQRAEASDANCDCLMLSIADLVNMIRVITGEVPPCR